MSTEFALTNSIKFDKIPILRKMRDFMPFKVIVRKDFEAFTSEYFESTPLAKIITDSGFSFDMPCGGRGVCGNCKVYVSGTISKITEIEREILGNEIEKGARLSCKATALGECVIDIPKNTSPNFKRDNYISINPDPITADTQCFACAVDVGTTTLAFRYYSLPDGNLVFSDSSDNPQRIHGADVITRIDFDKDNFGQMTCLINKAINDSKFKFGKEVEFYVITANTVMMHFLAGLDASGIATAPFMPKSLFGDWAGNRYYMPCANAYIGGDAIASVLDSGMTERDEVSLLIDVGTNNECFLWDGKQLFACSTPAGPAFEGASISCGMPARNGAIYQIGADKSISVLGNERATGICGSAMIDALAYLLQNKFISSDGSVIEDLPDFDSIKLNPEDISQLQLAKSAICSGILTLLEQANIKAEMVKKLYVTGSFGRHLNLKNAESIGLLPKGLTNANLLNIGGAINGASIVLLDKKQIKAVERIAKETKVIELADSEYFAKCFIENLYFKNYEEN